MKSVFFIIVIAVKYFLCFMHGGIKLLMMAYNLWNEFTLLFDFVFYLNWFI